MKCVVCHGGDIKQKEVTEEIKTDGNIVLLPINVLICQSCGERYYDRLTIQKLEKFEKDVKNHKRKLKEIGKVLQV